MNDTEGHRVRHIILLGTLVFGCFVGCTDTPARQQQAEEARRLDTANDLRDLGEAIQHETNSESTPASENQLPKDDKDSPQSETGVSEAVPKD